MTNRPRLGISTASEHKNEPQGSVDKQLGLPLLIVIALCGPVGAPLRTVSRHLVQLLKGKFSYSVVETIKLSKFIEQNLSSKKASWEGHPAFRIKDLLLEGDRLRHAEGDDILATFAIRQILEQLAALKSPVRAAFIIDSIKTSHELELLREVFSDRLYVIGVYSPLDHRKTSLRAAGSTDDKDFHEIIDADSGEERIGPKIKEVFPKSDYFIRLKEQKGNTILERDAERKLDRFVRLLHSSM